MQYVLFDDAVIREALLPLTFTRPVAKIRIGILTIHDKWELYLGKQCLLQTQPYLEAKFANEKPSGDIIFINGAVCPTRQLCQHIQQLAPGESIYSYATLICYRQHQHGHSMPHLDPLNIVKNTWDIFQLNGKELIADFSIVTTGRQSETIKDPFTRVYNPDNVFIEEGVSVKAAILNAESGPIYLGRNSDIQDGAIIKGPFAVCNNAQIAMGAKMRGATTIGPHCKVGGEISNSVFLAYSNKAHEGFVGNSVIGEWCNLGADTNTSNLKNNYGEVEVYSYGANAFVKTGLQFCGLVMGDHSKSSINTMFNTGTVVGFNANIFGSGFPPKFVPSYAWGGAEGFTKFDLEKSYEVAQKVMARRNLEFTIVEKDIFEEIFHLSK